MFTFKSKWYQIVLKYYSFLRKKYLKLLNHEDRSEREVQLKRSRLPVDSTVVLIFEGDTFCVGLPICKFKQSWLSGWKLSVIIEWESTSWLSSWNCGPSPFNEALTALLSCHWEGQTSGAHVRLDSLPSSLSSGAFEFGRWSLGFVFVRSRGGTTYCLFNFICRHTHNTNFFYIHIKTMSLKFISIWIVLQEWYESTLYVFVSEKYNVTWAI